MARFDTMPPSSAVPRALPEDTPAAEFLPEDVELPEPEADPTANLPEELGPPEGLPMIPVVEAPEAFPEDVPEAAWDDLPWA